MNETPGPDHFVSVAVHDGKVIVESTGPAAMTAAEVQDLIDELSDAKFVVIASEKPCFLTFRSNDWDRRMVRGQEKYYYRQVCTEDGQVRHISVGIKVHEQLQDLLTSLPTTLKLTNKQGVYLVDRA